MTVTSASTASRVVVGVGIELAGRPRFWASAFVSIVGAERVPVCVESSSLRSSKEADDDCKERRLKGAIIALNRDQLGYGSSSSSSSWRRELATMTEQV